MCMKTGCPSRMKKLSLVIILSSFKNHVKVKFLFIMKMGNITVLHMVHVSSAFAATPRTDYREMRVFAKSFEVAWCNVHRPSHQVSGDPGFKNELFVGAFNYLGVKYLPLPAQRHNMFGSMERENVVLRNVIERLLADAEHIVSKNDAVIDYKELLSSTTDLCNTTLGKKKRSGFELVQGYDSALVGLVKSPFSEEMYAAHQEKVAKRALNRIKYSPNQ